MGTMSGVPGSPVVVSTGDVHAPASNTAAVVTYTAAGAGVSHVVSGIAWSYLGVPTSGTIKIEDGSGNTIFSLDTGLAGIGVITFPRPKKGTPNTDMIITLGTGGVAITGKIGVLNHWTE
jgi:hypothetical protein